MPPEFIWSSLKMEGCREGLSLKSAPQSCSIIQERDKPSQMTAFQHFGYFFVVVVTALRNMFLENFYWSICLWLISCASAPYPWWQSQMTACWLLGKLFLQQWLLHLVKTRQCHCCSEGKGSTTSWLRQWWSRSWDQRDWPVAFISSPEHCCPWSTAHLLL